MTHRPDTPELTTLEATQRRAQYWQQQAEHEQASARIAHLSRDEWRTYALALGREYLTELGHPPTTRAPDTITAGPDETTQ